MRWIYRRTLTAFLTIIATTNIIFFLLRLMPGNAIDYLVLEYVETFRISVEEAYSMLSGKFAMGLTQPLHLQYIDFLSNVVRGNLGTSLVYGCSVSEIIALGMPWTIFTVSIGLITSFIVGIFVGLVSAYKRGSWLDKILCYSATSLVAIPNYVLAYVFIIIFSRILKLFPMRGAYDSVYVAPGFNLPFIQSVLQYSFLPILCYIVGGLGTWLLRMRNSTISVLGSDYISCATARGLKESKIMWKYAGRNAVLPLFTLFAISAGHIFGGSTVIEFIFQYPGVGFYISRSVYTRDYPLMQGLFLMLTATITLSNLIADILYSKIDPRVRFE